MEAATAMMTEDVKVADREEEARTDREAGTERPAGRGRKTAGGRGLIHIYCGDGKGKTTCGMGLCLRAAGAGMRVLIYQFMKDNSSSERQSMEHVPGVTLARGPEKIKFSFRMTEEEKKEQRAENGRKLKELFRLAREKDFDVLFLDEAVYAARAGVLPEEELLGYLDRKPEKLEVILTGQKPSEELCRRADYITEMKKVKHPFDQGIGARDGIER